MVCRMPVDSIWEAASTNTTSAMPKVVATVVVRRTHRLSRLYFNRANMRSSLSLLDADASPQPAQCVCDPQLSHSVDGHHRREHRKTHTQRDGEPGDLPVDHDGGEAHGVLQCAAHELLEQGIRDAHADGCAEEPEQPGLGQHEQPELA